MRTLFLMYKTNFKLAVREFSSVLFGILLPAGLIILLGFIADDRELASQLHTNFGAVSTLGIASVGLMGLPLVLSDWRGRKILKRYKVTPVSPGILLLSQLLFGFTLSFVSMGLVYAISALMFEFSLAGSVLGFLGAFTLVMVAMHAIGMIVASLAKNTQIAGVIASLIYFPMIMLSGATIPRDVFPAPLQRFANILPLTHGIDLLTRISMGEPVAGMGSLVVLSVVTVLGISVSLKFFKWE